MRLGLCCSRPEGFRSGPAQSSLENAVQFFQVSQADRSDEILSLAQLDSSAADLEESIREAVEHDVTHILFLSPGVLLPFYSIQTLLAMRRSAVSGISWTWRAGPPGGAPEIFPRIGYFDPESRAYPYFGWTAPDLFEVDWCGLDCLLLAREALEEIAEPLEKLRGYQPALRISLALRSQGISILIDSFIQCPQVVLVPSRLGGYSRKLVPSSNAWLEFSRDYRYRSIPQGPVFDPAYRGRAWYRDWIRRCVQGGI